MPGRNPKKLLGSRFRVGTRKFFRVPGWNRKFFRVGTRNPEIPSSGFQKFPGYFRVFPHCFPTRKNHDFSGFFRVGNRNPEFRWKPYSKASGKLIFSRQLNCISEKHNVSMLISPYKFFFLLYQIPFTNHNLKKYFVTVILTFDHDL